MKLPLRKNTDNLREFKLDLVQHSEHTWCNSQTLLDVQYCDVNNMFMLHVIGLLITNSAFFHITAITVGWRNLRDVGKATF